MTHPEGAWRDRRHHVVEITDFEEPGQVRREIVRNPLLLNRRERAEATGRESDTHTLVVEGMPQRGLSAEGVAEHAETFRIHPVVLLEHIEGLKHVEEILRSKARAVQQAVCKEKRFLLAAL